MVPSLRRAALLVGLLGACAASSRFLSASSVVLPRIPDEAPAAETAPQHFPWGLSREMLERLSRVADAYRDYALRLSCIETVRVATYDSGEAEKETVRGYAYLLYRDANGRTLRELRQRVRSDGSISREEVRDEEPFPPAYGWVDLFSRFYQPFFAYRDRGERFEGYDWVREIEFRGALPFTDGKDIREWEGTVLVDAARGTPLEIHAQPSGQDERLRVIFDRWSRSLSFMGFRLGPRPFAYRCRVQYRTRKDGLTFPTELRYDTLRAVGAKQTVPWQASTRTYDRYRFFRVDENERLEGPVSPEAPPSG